MTMMVDNGVDAAITGKLPTGVTDHEIGFTALMIWATHPLTWLIAYAGVEGTVRLVSIEIRACRRKEDWIPPRIVRYQNEFYRLEEFSRGTASRPYLYTLRRLPAGVMGRSVLQYSPEAPVLRGKS